MCTLGAKNPTDDDKAHCILVSIGHFTLIEESRFGAEAWLITQNLKPEKGCVIEKLSSPSSKENEGIVISKDDSGKLSGNHKHMHVLKFLDHGDTANCFCGTCSLRWPFFAKGRGYFAIVLPFCMKMPGVIHPTGHLFMEPSYFSYIISYTNSMIIVQNEWQ